MPVTRTYTATNTYARSRAQLVEAQFTAFAKRHGYSRKFVSALPEGVRERWVTSLTVYGNNAHGQSLASVELRIDWTAYDELQESTTVSIDGRWKDDVSPQLGAFGDGFENFVVEHRLTLNRRVGISGVYRNNPVDYRAIMARLHLVDGKPITWHGKRYGQSERLRRLAELQTGVEFAD